MIDDDEYVKRKVELENNQVRIKAKLEDGEQSASEWIELTEKAFAFCQNDPYWFEHGSIQEKRMILTAVGSNLILHNKTLTIQSDAFFVAVQNAVECDSWLPWVAAMRTLLAGDGYWRKTENELARFWVDMCNKDLLNPLPLLVSLQ